MSSVLTQELASQIAAAASKHRREQKFPPMGFAVLDASGQLVVYLREDGASMFRFDIARAKAWGAVGMGQSSRVLAERARDNPNFFVAFRFAA